LIHINGELCEYSLWIQVPVEKEIETGILFEVAVYGVVVFIPAEFLQDECLSCLPGPL